MLKIDETQPVLDPGVLDSCWFEILGKVFFGGLDLNACVLEGNFDRLLFRRVKAAQVFDVFWVLVFS